MVVKRILKKTKQFITICDLFSTIELLRYRQNPEFKSANGGLCSIAVILAFAIIFTQTILNTFNKQTITSQTTLFEQAEPSSFKTTDSPFLFALGINNLNLNNATTKYFNILFSQKIVFPDGSKQTKVYPLQPCDKLMWTGVDPKFGQTFDKLKLSNWLCLPPDITLQFQGKYSSSNFRYAKISVQNCTNDNRTCATPAEIDTFISANGAVTFNYYFLNTIINADDSKYLDNYLEDRNYFQFTRTMGMSANIFISSFNIQTDESLWPLQNVKQDNGGLVYQKTQTFIYQPTTDFIQLYLRKSSLSLSITRSFRKYDDTFSYIGGLFSSIMAALFLMMKYNEYAYEIDIAAKLYRLSKTENIRKEWVNILSFFSYGCYCLLDFVKLTPNWKLMKEYDDTREQIGKQLDITLVLNKLRFLEDCMQYLFTDCQLNCLYLKRKSTLQQASDVRQKLGFRSRLMRIKKKYEKQLPYMTQLGQTKYMAQLGQINNNLELQIYDSNVSKDKQQSSVDIKESVFKNKNKQNKSEITIIESSQSHHIDDYQSDLQSQHDQNQEKAFYSQMVSNVQKLRDLASNSNERAQNIYKSLDKGIKCLSNINLQSNNQDSMDQLKKSRTAKQKNALTSLGRIQQIQINIQ